MADDAITAALAPIRERVAACDDGFSMDGRHYIRSAGDVPLLLAAVDAALKPHSPRSDRVLGSSCFTHRRALNIMLPVQGCESCVQDRQREVCPECRDEYGDPVLFQDCRARSAVLAALTGKEPA